ncbi:MAG: 3-oxoacyl-ACP synthase [Myxococcales bacterium]|nr:3-oxoacyl-ACP synthase [Myxococcales bacterium]
MRIMGTSGCVFGREVTTRELVEEALPDRDPEELERKIGIATRYWVGAHQMTRAQMGAQALREALDDAGMDGRELERIIFINSAGGDTFTPATANAIIGELGLNGSCDCFDLTNACMGFMTALDLSARSIVTGMGPIGLVVVELIDPFLIPEEYRTYLVFGSAATAAVVGPTTTDGEGLLAMRLSNDASHPSSVIFRRPDQFGEPNMQVQFVAPNKEMQGIALTYILDSARQMLEACELTIDDIDWVLPHQPNGRMFDAILEGLGAPEERAVRVVDRIGSVAAAAIPYSLDQLFKTREVKPGDLILMVGVGTGVAYGTAIYRVGER